MIDRIEFWGIREDYTKKKLKDIPFVDEIDFGLQNLIDEGYFRVAIKLKKREELR